MIRTLQHLADFPYGSTGEAEHNQKRLLSTNLGSQPAREVTAMGAVVQDAGFREASGGP